MRQLRIVTLLASALTASLAASTAQAQIQQTSDSANIPQMTTNWMETRALDQFDPALGDLLSVTLIADADIAGNAMFESQDAQPAIVTLDYSSEIAVTRSDTMALLLLANPTFNTVSNLAAFDGTLDFMGPSGEMFPNLSASDSVMMTFNAPLSADLQNLFVGTGTFGIDVAATGTSAATGAGNLTAQIATNAQATITVVYEFEGIEDCNGNMIDDADDITNGTSEDCNGNGTPDECEPDCNGNGIPDACDPTACPCIEINRREPGSLLLYCEYQNGPGYATVWTVTNTSCGAGGSAVTVEFRYINADDCGEANQTAVLTPCDTLTYLTTAHTGIDHGYGYIYAKSNQITPANPAGEPISFNHLIGQSLVVDGFATLEYSTNAVSFKAVPTQGNPTDIDGPLGEGDGVRDLDNVEYEPAPDEIYIPRFLGQGATQQGICSELCLINLSGGSQFKSTPTVPSGGTLVAILGYNDNEIVFSAEHLFSCWDKVKLADINPAFLNSNLRGFNDDPNEILGAPAQEAGWFKLNGAVANSSVDSIIDPAIYAVLVETVRGKSAADLPFECCSQLNGDLLPTSIFGDFPFLVGDNQ